MIKNSRLFMYLGAKAIADAKLKDFEEEKVKWFI